jgi:hypothetical protein|tara:strand:- start:285 stop:602 length:318 start_codon:yes stop_codon:yes gene_type:complete
MKNIKDQLAGVAALIGVLAAIGGGFIKYGEVMTKIDVLEGASKGIDMSFLSDIKVLEEKVAKLSDELNGATNHGHTKMLVNEKQIELLQVQIEEIKVSTSNPLAN